MEDEYEVILNKLTESQRDLLVRHVQTDLRPMSARESDVDVLLRLGLYDFNELVPHKESSSGFRVSSKVSGTVEPSQLGREWVTWYLRK